MDQVIKQEWDVPAAEALTDVESRADRPDVTMRNGQTSVPA